MSDEPAAVVFDVNGTLSDMSPMGKRFADVGAPEQLAPLWFATVLREGLAATVTGRLERFTVLARENLRILLGGLALDRNLEQAVEHIISGFMSLPLHPDVAPGVRGLRDGGLRLVTLSNGSAQVAERLLDEAGLRGEFEQVLSVEDSGLWKPAAAAYEYAAQRCGLDRSDMLLVAVHPWDIDGAARAGMRTAWLDRSGDRYPAYAAAPDHAVGSLTDLIGAISH